MYAIIETGGKQYRVQEGDVLNVEKLPADVGASMELDRVLAVQTDEGFKSGNPTVEGARVQVKVLAHGKGRKIIVFKYKAKKNYRRKQGHRQPYTRILVEKIIV